MTDDNPYAAPDRDEPRDPAPPGGPRHLNDVNNVMLAAFLGGAIGGAAMIYENERELGRSGNDAIIGGLAGTVVLATAAFLLPAQVPTIVFTLAALFGCRAWMESKHGPQVTEALAAGVPRASRWRAAGFGLLMLVPTIPLVLAVTVPLALLFKS